MTRSVSARRIKSGMALHVGFVCWLLFAIASFSAAPGPALALGFTPLMGSTPFTGRVRAIVVRSDDPKTIWVAAATGGLWVSRDAGENWSRTDDFLPTLTFSSLVADPSNPDVMYAGSGEIFTFISEGTWLRAQDRGAGIFKTRDGGATWSQLANTRDWFYVSRIAVHPLNPKIVLAATEKGLFRSGDFGANWTRVLPANPTTQVTFLDVKFHPSLPDNAVATAHLPASAGATANDLGIFYSENGGLSWRHALPLPVGLPENDVRIELAPSLTQLQPGTWLALYIADRKLFLIRSGNRGRTWTGVTGFLRAITCKGLDDEDLTPRDLLTNNRRYTGALWVNPLDPARILAGGGPLCFSTDGGTTFTKYPDPRPSTIHGDHHALATGPAVTSSLAVVYNGNDGGVNKLEWDATPSNTRLNNNLAIQQFHSATMSPISGVVVGGTQDIGSLRRSDAGVWTDLLKAGTGGSDDIFVATDPNDRNFWYFGTSLGRIFRSRDEGASGESITVDKKSLESACFNQTPLLLDPTNPKVLYAGCNQLWRTLDAKAPDPATVAASWSPILKVASDHLITTMAVAPSNPSVMWVGTRQGTGRNTLLGREVWRTTNLQDASPKFDSIILSGLPLRAISRIAVHRTDPTIVYVSLTGWASDGNLWRGRLIGSNDATWRDLSVGLPPDAHGPIHSVSVHPTIPNWIYAGTDAGLYVSHDDGATWSAITRGPARVPISDLTWVDKERLVVATYGRGVFVLDQKQNPEHVIVERQSYLAGAQQRSGHLENLLDSDDFRQVSGDSRDRIGMELTGRAGLPRTGVALVLFTIESSASSFPNSQMTIELFNFVSQRYLVVSSRTVGPADQTIQGGVAGPVAKELISATGELRARVRWSGAGLGSSAIDLAHWTIDRP